MPTRNSSIGTTHVLMLIVIAIVVVREINANEGVSTVTETAALRTSRLELIGANGQVRGVLSVENDTASIILKDKDGADVFAVSVDDEGIGRLAFVRTPMVPAWMVSTLGDGTAEEVFTGPRMFPSLKFRGHSEAGARISVLDSTGSRRVEVGVLGAKDSGIEVYSDQERPVFTATGTEHGGAALVGDENGAVVWSAHAQPDGGGKTEIRGQGGVLAWDAFSDPERGGVTGTMNTKGMAVWSAFGRPDGGGESAVAGPAGKSVVNMVANAQGGGHLAIRDRRESLRFFIDTDQPDEGDIESVFYSPDGDPLWRLTEPRLRAGENLPDR